nr:Gfo/Idh/MocA family oxidoreductase [Flexithrix dorotheae]
MKKNRRSFIKKLGASSAIIAGAPTVLSAKNRNQHVEILAHPKEEKKNISANDKIRIACLGTGGMGIGDTQTALMVDGVEVVAACDLYDGRLTKAKELWGKDIQTTRDYKEIIDRDDIDAVIVATSDHWHEKIAIDSMKKGKAVYCEKPMVQYVEEGHRLINAQKETKQVFQVGSQFVSSIIHAKAKALLAAGEIGKLNFVEAQFDRFNAIGAWQYSIPLDASEKTVDWKTYVSNTTKRDFDPKRFFRWRNYLDYGTGVSGDLFVHLLSMLHFITGSKGPTSIMSMGGLRYWTDGREVPDIQIGMFEYPETDAHPDFNLVLRANFADGSGGKYLFRLVGSEGEISVGWDELKLTKKKLPKAPGMSIGSFPEAQKEAYTKWYNEKYPEEYEMVAPEEFIFKTPKGYKGDRYLHFKNFFDSVRNGTPVVEDAVFGMRAAGVSLAGNKSYFEKKLVQWDPENMQIKEV